MGPDLRSYSLTWARTGIVLPGKTWIASGNEIGGVGGQKRKVGGIGICNTNVETLVMGDMFHDHVSLDSGFMIGLWSGQK